MRNLKIGNRPEKEVFSLWGGKQPGATNDVMFAYVHEKINILFSVGALFSFFFMIVTWIHKVYYTWNFKKYQFGYYRNV